MTEGWYEGESSSLHEKPAPRERCRRSQRLVVRDDCQTAGTEPRGREMGYGGQLSREMVKTATEKSFRGLL